MKFIQLTNDNTARSVWINVTTIVMMEKVAGGKTRIYLSTDHDDIIVRESPDAIMAKL